MKDQASLSRSSILGRPSGTLGFEEAISGDYRIIDVRSPKEFQEGSLPGAINIPIFDNEQRCLVGTIYRQGGRDEAIDTGFALVESRLAELLAGFTPFRGERIALFCARGGMRSRSVVNLLLQHGFAAWQLEGGYKRYRQLLLEVLERFSPRLIVLHGMTGTGKTRILQRLDPAIDLEDLAQHQSSLFGAMNRQPRSQKWFDSHLHRVIATRGPEPFFIEGGSPQLGKVFLPAGLIRAMREGELVLITASIETRVARILEDYPVEDEQTVLEVERILKTLRRKLGTSIVDELCRLLRGDRLAEMVRILLVEYYDKRYQNVMKDYRYRLSVSSEDLDQAAAVLRQLRVELLQRSRSASDTGPGG